MGSTRYSVSFGEAVLIQTATILYIPFIPLLWIIVIISHTVGILTKKLSLREFVDGVVTNLLFVTSLPLLLTFLHCTLAYEAISCIMPFDAFVGTKMPTARLLDASGATGSYGTLGEYGIRLLLIHPGSFNDSLRGDLVVANLQKPPAYDALSYTWADEQGNAERTSVIYIANQKTNVFITKNCAAAMRRLRLSKKKRCVWIDSVCINQESVAERSHQVSLMGLIFTFAREVIAYIGEGECNSDKLFDWLNNIDAKELDVPPIWDISDVVRAVGSPDGTRLVGRSERAMQQLRRTTGWLADRVSGKVRFSWGWGHDYKQVPSVNTEQEILSEADVVSLSRKFFSRRWFKRVWVLQEIALPNRNRIRIMCGSKTTTAERALHAMSMLEKAGAASSTVRTYLLFRKRLRNQPKSHLLDLLIETRDRECTDPRDKIFGILNIAELMDDAVCPTLQARYELSVSATYEWFSTLFIAQHGPGFFLSLIKSPPATPGLPSWAADWSVPWPNYKAVRGRTFAAGLRSVAADDGASVIFQPEYQRKKKYSIMILVKPRITRGYFTRDGHMDDSTGLHVENVEDLADDQVLVEIYPGLAALLRKAIVGEYYRFVQTCPHAISEAGIEELVGKWVSVVVDGTGPETTVQPGDANIEYLTPPSHFRIC